MKRPAFAQIDNVKPMFNIGCLMDIPTGTYMKGKYGEHILNGGLGLITGIVSTGNMFKSTILHYMMCSAYDKIAYAIETHMSTYDTEVNINEDHLLRMVQKFDRLKDRDIFLDQTWLITDKTKCYANEMHTLLRDFLDEKKKDYSNKKVNTPFLNREGTDFLSIIPPTLGEIDSFSEFETQDVAKIQTENELGDSGGNTIHMRSGLAKTRFLMELPGLLGSTNHYMLMTAHVGTEIPMASGPMAPQPKRALPNMKMGDKIKGTTGKFFFLTHNCWQAMSVSKLMNKGTLAAEYPRHGDDVHTGDTDLNLVMLTCIRGKFGMSGINIPVVVSQTDGVLPSLSEFHYIKENSRYGIEGSLQNYVVTLWPDVKLGRTTVRHKIDNDPKLRRAINITAEMLQMLQYWRHINPESIPDPALLRQKLIDMGYDWNILLETRGWWTIDNDKHDIKFLSTQDLINMYHETYHPYWYPKELTANIKNKALTQEV